MDRENAIEVRDLTKDFKISTDRARTLKDLLVRSHSRAARHRVLSDISLDIKKGETVGLIGVNGSGKSTLLKLMSRIIYPTSGTLDVKGRLASLLELGAGFHPDFTGRENIYFNASIFGMTKKQIQGRIGDIIAFSELGSAIDEPIRTYSSGMYMRLAFSVAVNVDADILLIDEILAVGDQHFQDKCFSKLLELKASGKTIVIVSHALDQVRRLCTRAIWIYKGTLRLDGDPAYVIEAYKKQSALDHKEEKKAAVESGSDTYRGVVFLDSPADRSRALVGEQIVVNGWRIADCEDQSLVLAVDGKEIVGVSDVSRPDVAAVYEEEYAGFVEERPLGFSAAFTPEEAGEITICARVLADGREVASREVSVRVE